MVNQLFPFGVVTTWEVCQRYLPHAILCANYIEKWNIVSLEAAHLLYNIASYLDDRAQYQEAEPLYDCALAIRERVLGPDHPGTIKTLENYANLLRKVNRDQEASTLEVQIEVRKSK